MSPPVGSTILALLQGGSYTSFEALEEDVESATADILASLGSTEPNTVPSSLEDTRLHAKVLAFRKMLKNLVTREKVRRAQIDAKHGVPETSTELDIDTKDKAMQIKKEDDEPQSRTVLTLYGSAQGPKQLFSSLQQPMSITPTDANSTLDRSVKVTLPLRESTLPNIISTTEVYPLPDDMDETKKEKQTIGKLFKAPAHLPPLYPPKLAKPLTTRGSTITFGTPEAPKPSRRTSHSYANQNLSAGYWLGYGGVDMPKDPISPTAKQKSRQRALSTGEAQQPASEATLAAVKIAKDDALFRSAYSSFAPTRDNSSAVIPEETKNMVWWQKVGEKRFNEVFPIDPELLGLDGPEEGDANKPEVGEEEAFKEAVENFEPIEGGPLSEPKEKSDLDKDVEEVLKEISELLETLASHQRIRNSSLATNPRTPVIQNSSLASLAGSPSTPSSEEIDVYQMLKSQLSLMISQLPPYAVAKLNGDQLEELNISRTIILENKDIPGVLEEDQFTRMAKAPLTAPVAPPALNRMVSGSSSTHSHFPSASAQYGRSTPSVHSSARPVSTSQTYYQQPQSAHRSPSVHYQRSSSGTSQGYQATAASFATTPRQSFPATQAYGQQTPRGTYAQAAPGQYFSQRSSQPSGYGGAAAPQFYGSTPQTQTHNRYSQQAQNGFYQRPQNVPTMYSGTSSSQARTASPLKVAPTASQVPGYGSRPGFGTPVSGGQLRSTYYPPAQYGNAQPHTPAPTTPGFSANPQQMMLDRQQAQAAAQSQARLAAQSSFNRQGSGTPQPPPNGQYGGPSNGAAPMVT